ncbi:MAG: hypothetical protein WCD18_19980 [Thermosynechococcaceae cyanobacterium]
MQHRLEWFRARLESNSIKEISKETQYLRPLQGFPGGCCKIASILLARFLIEECLLSSNLVFVVVNGETENPEFMTHAWVLADSIIIDITADQFPEVKDKVIWTKENTWHKKFKGSEPFLYKEFINSFNIDAREEYENIYSQILSESEDSSSRN